MNYSVAQYRQLPLLVFPLKLDSGFTVTELQGQCTNCSKTLVELRGEVFEHAQCSEVQFAGLCHDCKLLVTCRFRYYRDGHVLTCHGDEWKGMYRLRESSLRLGAFGTGIKKRIFRFLDWIFGWHR